MEFSEFVRKYENAEIYIDYIDTFNGISIYDFYGFTEDEKGKNVGFDYLISGDFKVYQLKGDYGWGIDNIEPYELVTIDKEKNRYAINDCWGRYIEFSFTVFEIEELHFTELEEIESEYCERQTEALKRLRAECLSLSSGE